MLCSTDFIGLTNDVAKPDDGSASAGLTTDLMLSDDLPTPANLSAVFALATDDVMLFTLGAPEAALPWLAALDKSIADAGIQAHAKKAVTAVLDETVIGIDVVDGCFLAPHAPKLAKVLSGCLHFLRERNASQLEVAGIMGHAG